MLREYILKLAAKAGFRVESWLTNPPKPSLYYASPEQLEAFAKVIAGECADLCKSEFSDGALDIADAICARFGVDPRDKNPAPPVSAPVTCVTYHDFKAMYPPKP
jgi:hypothetical protein